MTSQMTSSFLLVTSRAFSRRLRIDRGHQPIFGQTYDTFNFCGHGNRGSKLGVAKNHRSEKQISLSCSKTFRFTNIRALKIGFIFPYWRRVLTNDQINLSTKTSIWSRFSLKPTNNPLRGSYLILDVFYELSGFFNNCENPNVDLRMKKSFTLGFFFKFCNLM